MKEKNTNITIELPVNVGDTVWCTTSDQIDIIVEPIECIISQITIEENNELKFMVYSKSKDYLPFSNVKFPNHMNVRTMEDFGLNVFHDKDIAAMKLKKINKKRSLLLMKTYSCIYSDKKYVTEETTLTRAFLALVNMILEEHNDALLNDDLEVVVKEEKTEEEISPYIQKLSFCVGIREEYNPNYGDEKICECGHPYHRHFDLYEGPEKTRCKYCNCHEFIPMQLDGTLEERSLAIIEHFELNIFSKKQLSNDFLVGPKIQACYDLRQILKKLKNDGSLLQEMKELFNKQLTYFYPKKGLEEFDVFEVANIRVFALFEYCYSELVSGFSSKKVIENIEKSFGEDLFGRELSCSHSFIKKLSNL